VRYTGLNAIKGIIAQAQVMISIAMALIGKKFAFIVAIAINILLSVIVLILFINNKDLSILPGVVIPFITTVTVSIIYIFYRRLNNKIQEVVIQNQRICELYEDVSLKEKTLYEQNKKLKEYNLIMENNKEELTTLANYDGLTKLPNRNMIFNQIDGLIANKDTQSSSFSLVFIDLDGFKKINDSSGHYSGDLMLKQVASKLKRILHKEDVLGRLGGDEFALIIHRDISKEEILEYLEGFRAELLDVFMIENASFRISASFGVSIFPNNGTNATDLLKSADTAMYNAKECGKNCIKFFDEEMKVEILKRLDLEEESMLSIDNNELFLVFQPQYSSFSKKLKGVEVLLRWNSLKLGFISPAEFIPIVEETGFIITMGKWVLEECCKKIKYFRNEYDSDLLVSINISAIQIMEPTFLSMVKKTLLDFDIDGKNLEFEITESVFISSIDYVIDIFKELKEMGIRIALDDFGTGYSSLSYIQLLPIDVLKIDKSFIDDIENNERKKSLVGSIISLVHNLNISVVAEGVENEAQLNILKEQNCDYIQGFFWGKPLSEKEIDVLIRKS
jgi:diguanylate cyclase (GGDEF)-like protein